MTINLQKINKKDLNFLMKIPFIGMYNNNPIFIISSLLKKNNYELNLITIDSYKNNKFPKSLLTK